MGNIVIAGDINAKTSIESDFVSDYLDDHSPVNEITGYEVDEPLRRRNRDGHPVDAHGSRFLELCKSCRLRIINGRTRGDRFGNFTRWPLSLRESPSTLDYIAADTTISIKIESFMVLPHLGQSDHECLSATIKTKGFYVECQNKANSINCKEASFKRVNSAKVLLKLKTDLGKEKLNNFLATHAGSNKNSVDNMYTDFVDLMNSFSRENGSSRPKRANKNVKKGTKKRKPWYSSDCRVLKSALNIAENKYRRNPFDSNLKQTLLGARKRYKKACKDSELLFRNKLTKKLLSIEKVNPKGFGT